MKKYLGAIGVPHYTKNGRLYTGEMHKDSTGRLMTGKFHNANSRFLFHNRNGVGGMITGNVLIGTVKGGMITIPYNDVDEIKKSISLGYNIIREGLISAKRKGIVLSNKKYQVRGVYPFELKSVIQKMIDESK